MSQERTASSDGDADGEAGPSAPSGRMLYHLFSAEERRRIVSIYLDNHAVAFSAAAISDATGMDEGTAAGMLDSLEAVGFLIGETASEAYRLAGSEDPAVQRIAGDLDDDASFYRLDKDSDVATALGKADAAAGANTAAFFRAAPDIDHEE